MLKEVILILYGIFYHCIRKFDQKLCSGRMFIGKNDRIRKQNLKERLKTLNDIQKVQYIKNEKLGLT